MCVVREMHKATISMKSFMIFMIDMLTSTIEISLEPGSLSQVSLGSRLYRDVLKAH